MVEPSHDHKKFQPDGRFKLKNFTTPDSLNRAHGPDEPVRGCFFRGRMQPLPLASELNPDLRPGNGRA